MTTDEMREAFFKLFSSPETGLSGFSDEALRWMFVGYKAALQSLPRVTEAEVIKLVTESIHGPLDAWVNSKYKAKQAINALKSAGYRIVRAV
jgi:hypothetical protein